MASTFSRSSIAFSALPNILRFKSSSNSPLQLHSSLLPRGPELGCPRVAHLRTPLSHLVRIFIHLPGNAFDVFHCIQIESAWCTKIPYCAGTCLIPFSRAAIQQWCKRNHRNSTASQGVSFILSRVLEDPCTALWG